APHWRHFAAAKSSRQLGHCVATFVRSDAVAGPNERFSVVSDRVEAGAPGSKMSNGTPHAPHVQNAPTGGGGLHDGHTKPSRGGAFALSPRDRAARKLLMHCVPTNAAMMASHVDWLPSANHRRPAEPTRPMTAVTIKLRRRPIRNQSNARRIWPPS